MELKADQFFAPTNKKVFKLLSDISKKLRSNDKIKRYEANYFIKSTKRSLNVAR